MCRPVSQIVGHGDVPGDAPRCAHPVVVDRARRDADARGAAHCLDCDGAAETGPVCDACWALRGELHRRIEESVESLHDAEESGQYVRPVRPGWKGWKRVLWKCESCGDLKPPREFPSTNAPYVCAEHARWCRSCVNASYRKSS